LTTLFSPIDNHRSDKYGSDLAGRIRFGIEAGNLWGELLPQLVYTTPEHDKLIAKVGLNFKACGKYLTALLLSDQGYVPHMVK